MKKKVEFVKVLSFAIIVMLPLIAVIYLFSTNAILLGKVNYYETQFKDTCELSQIYRTSFNELAKAYNNCTSCNTELFTTELNCTDLMLK